MSFLVHRPRKRKDMAERSWRPFKMRVAAAISAIAMCGAAGAQEKDPSSASSPQLSVTGRVIAAELSPEIKRMIDAARRLYETPGLILDRMAIYETFDAWPEDTRLFKLSDGSRGLNEILKPKKLHQDPRWKIELSYSELLRTNSWIVDVKFDVHEGRQCYSSRLVENYWGKKFTYRPLGAHALLADLIRPADLPPIGPHDGEPYNTGFHSSLADTARIIFDIGRGGCLLAISAGNHFNFKEYSDDRIYHE